ncbi:arylsulfatase A-like enzyme [Pontibacter ummariensis]|uniref:Arylsulfatase A n=1 Tax=Pontibacter ummariensis TaxID=1610492 RepID=A0A239L2I6_9BACT|nr:arylsulfatase [Pontibacter ummariensis]PRY04322.1 arylsulfatase A-like enzyme [Pontibacter ummariensis]SNT24786.1 Arylsulfatase A [Pontibacter ummariensis]
MKKLTLLLLSCCCTLAAFAQKKPNVVFILVDDMGYGDLGCYGQELIETPNLDKLAANGVRFTQFYAGTSVCAPSRASLMTGKHTGHTPVRGNFEIEPEGQYPIPDSTFTMAEMFLRAGYTTGLFGKWGLGYPSSAGEPNKQGFDRFFGYNCQRQSHNFFPDHLWDNGQRVDLSNTPTDQQEYAADIIQKEALNFLEDNANNPFFLYLAYTLPHAALQLPEGDEVFEKYKRKFNEQPQPVKAGWQGVGYQPQAYPKAAYAAMVTKVDNYIGEVVQALKTQGIEKNTLIVFASDNGPHREGGNQPEFFNSSGGFRGIKRDLYEGGIRVPVIASWPSMIRKGRQSDYIGAFWDFLPTFAELTGQPAPQNIDGISILPMLTSKGKQAQHKFLYWEFHEDGGRQAVRLGDWKGVRIGVVADSRAPVQLFNLATDPAETTDVSAVHPEVVQEIERIMEFAHVEHESFPLVTDRLSK